MIHQYAFIDPSARLAAGVIVHAFAYIGAGSIVGAGCEIHQHAVIGRQPRATRAIHRPVPAVDDPVRLEAGCQVGCHAVIYRGVRIGPDCMIGDHAAIREHTRIGKACVVGAGVQVGQEVLMGDGARVMDGSVLIGRSRLDEGAFLGVGVVTSNDRDIDPESLAWNEARIKGPWVGAYAFIGSGSNLLAGVVVGENAHVAAGSLITKSVAPGAAIKGPKAA